MKRLICLVLSIMVWGGCSSYEPAEYSRVWQATERVLTRHDLLVQESQYREHTLVAVSQIRGDFLSRSRVKVVARIIEGEEGYAEPNICVLNQLDLGDAHLRIHPDYQTGEKWVNLSRNAHMEATLYNEILQELGVKNTYTGKAWQPPQETKNVETRLYPISAEPIPLPPDEE